ncbi:MAG: hypothetical protein J1G02_00645 [Clostridiales bacterium]|nr:hypothetical protein [Clostridiales bacterium]
MKYNCENEFDLKEIYRKLTSPVEPQMVKASEFFNPVMSLEEFQQRMEIAMMNRKQKISNK